jgi:hypothetical protein
VQGDFTETMLAEWEKHKGSQEGEDFLYAAFVKYKTEGNVAGVFDFGGRMIGAYPNSTRLQDVLGASQRHRRPRLGGEHPLPARRLGACRRRPAHRAPRW